MEDRESRADLRYFPANAAKPMVVVVDKYVRTEADRELIIKSIDRLIEENEQ